MLESVPLDLSAAYVKAVTETRCSLSVTPDATSRGIVGGIIRDANG